jgi:hypothetical protein
MLYAEDVGGPGQAPTSSLLKIKVIIKNTYTCSSKIRYGKE